MQENTDLGNAMSLLTIESPSNSPSSNSFSKRKESLGNIKKSLDLTAAALVNAVDNMSLNNNEENKEFHDGESDADSVSDENTETVIETEGEETKKTTTVANTTKDTEVTGGKAVKVYLRIRPTLNTAETKEELAEPTIKVLSDTKIETRPPTSSQSYKTGKRTATQLSFTHVFKGDAEQETVFSKAVNPVVDSFLTGQDGLVFAYGITNAGKTHTISGTTNQPGVLPRALTKIFEKVSNLKSVTVSVSYLEIYNEKYYDLLVPLPKQQYQQRKTLSLRGGKLDKLKHEIVKSSNDALNQLTIGSNNRSKAQTLLNCDSSRSHSVFNIVLKGLPGIDPKKLVRLSIVDLAGSERAKRTKNGGKLLAEAGNINLSLLTLMRCFSALRYNQRYSKQRQVPYRGSKLTMLLQTSFQGSGQIVMIVAASTTNLDFDETFQVLKKAAVARKVKGEAKSRVQHTNKQYDADGRRRRRQRAKTYKDLAHRFKNKRRSLSVDSGTRHLSLEGVSAEDKEKNTDDYDDDNEKKDTATEILITQPTAPTAPAAPTAPIIKGPPMPIFLDDDILKDDNQNNVDLEQIKAEIEDDIREECAEEMEKTLNIIYAQHASEINNIKKEKDEMWKKKMEDEIEKVMKLLKDAQDAVEVASAEESHNKEILLHKKEIIDDCEKEIDRFRCETSRKQTLLAKIQNELSEKTDLLMIAEEKICQLKGKNDELIKELEETCKLQLEGRQKKDYLLSESNKRIGILINERDAFKIDSDNKSQIIHDLKEKMQSLNVTSASNVLLQQKLDENKKNTDKKITEVKNQLENELNIEKDKYDALNEKCHNLQLSLNENENRYKLLLEESNDKYEKYEKMNTHLQAAHTNTVDEMEKIKRELNLSKDMNTRLTNEKNEKKGDKFQKITSLETELKQCKEANDKLKMDIQQQEDGFKMRQESLINQQMIDLQQMRTQQENLIREKEELKSIQTDKLQRLENEINILRNEIQLKDQKIESLSSKNTTTATPISSPTKGDRRKSEQFHPSVKKGENVNDTNTSPAKTVKKVKTKNWVKKLRSKITPGKKKSKHGYSTRSRTKEGNN